MKGTKEKFNYCVRYVRVFCKWLIISLVVGAIGGFVGSVFHMAVRYATDFRMENPMLIYLLPLGGIFIAALYGSFKVSGKGTNDVIDSIHDGGDVPILMVPAIFFATIITHCCGGSAGREGAALQIGGGIGGFVGKTFKLDEKEQRLAILCGMSAVFAALFGTPLTAALFPLEFVSVGVIYYSGFLPCICASLTAFEISIFLGLPPTRFTINVEVLTPELIIKVAVLAVGAAMVSIIFCLAMNGGEKLAKKIENRYFRIITGGVAVILLTLLAGNNCYNGAGGDIISVAIQAGACPKAAFLWKIAFTALTLCFGYKGGEIVPTFFIGACFGCVAGPLLNLPAGFAAAMSLAGMFCGAVNCPIASIFLGVELFGAANMPYIAVMCGVSYMLSGYYGIYKSQKIIYSKTNAEYINRFTK